MNNRKRKEEEKYQFQTPHKRKIPNVYKSISPSKLPSEDVNESSSLYDEDEVQLEGKDLVQALPSATVSAIEAISLRMLNIFDDIIYHAQESKKKEKIGKDRAWPSFVIVDANNLESLSAQFTCIPPVVLRSQLYAIVNIPTDVDRELDRLKTDNQIRIFKLQSDKNDYALMHTSDYTKQIELLKKRTNEGTEIIDLFLNKLLPTYFDAQISKEKLHSILHPDVKRINEESITVLVNAGLLMMKDIDTFWFAIPNAGGYMKSLVQGRKELLGIIQRTRWKEILQHDLQKKKLRFTLLGTEYHTEDLVGKGLAESIKTNAGTLIRLKTTK